MHPLQREITVNYLPAPMATGVLILLVKAPDLSAKVNILHFKFKSLCKRLKYIWLLHLYHLNEEILHCFFLFFAATCARNPNPCPGQLCTDTASDNNLYTCSPGGQLSFGS